jgi:DNA-binding response OmpR family regulator
MKPGLKIFIAEDEVTLAEIYSERFKRAGFEVKLFKDGLELLQGLSQDTPDVVLLDIMMPEMNGYDVLTSIKKNFEDKGKQDVTVIVWSNSGSQPDVDKALSMGAAAYLKKVDFTGDDLVQKVMSLMKQAK